MNLILARHLSQFYIYIMVWFYAFKQFLKGLLSTSSVTPRRPPHTHAFPRARQTSEVSTQYSSFINDNSEIPSDTMVKPQTTHSTHSRKTKKPLPEPPNPSPVYSDIYT
jgi:hypothetical protein